MRSSYSCSRQCTFYRSRRVIIQLAIILHIALPITIAAVGFIVIAFRVDDCPVALQGGVGREQGGRAPLT